VTDASESPSVDLRSLQERIREFVRERDWEQFHTPKNLLLALVGEVGELAEIFQWLSMEESTRVMEDSASASRVREELAVLTTDVVDAPGVPQ
jgi:dCTP diphosphatase